MFDFTFDMSYGDPQEVRVLAKRSLGAVTLKYRINGGAAQSVLDHGMGRRRTLRRRQAAPTTTSCAARSPGRSPTNSVKVWFEGGGADE